MLVYRYNHHNILRVAGYAHVRNEMVWGSNFQCWSSVWVNCALLASSCHPAIMSTKCTHASKVSLVVTRCIGTHVFATCALTLTLPGPSAGVSGSLDSYSSLKPLCSGMGEVVPARTSPTLLAPSPRTVLLLSCFKVLQCINCRDWHCKS